VRRARPQGPDGHHYHHWRYRGGDNLDGPEPYGAGNHPNREDHQGGDDHSGDDHSGDDHSGDDHSGDDHSGDGHQGDDDSGHHGEGGADDRGEDGADDRGGRLEAPGPGADGLTSGLRAGRGVGWP
jgi:hypothetical protein